MIVKKKRKKNKTTTHYVDNQKFYEAIVEHHKKVKEAKAAGKEAPRLSNYIGECLQKIAEGVAALPRFNKYSFKDEMIAEAVINSIRYFNSFNPETGNNPFAYFTTTTRNTFWQIINDEDEKRYATCRNFTNNVMLGGHVGPDGNILHSFDENGTMGVQKDVYENIHEFMHRFENLQEKRRKKRKETKKGLMAFDEDEEAS